MTDKSIACLPSLQISITQAKQMRN